MKGMHFIVIEDGAIAGTGVVKQGVGADKYLCEFPQQTGIRLSRIMPADNMVDWLFFNNQNSLQAYMQSQRPPKTPDGKDDETPPDGKDDETPDDETPPDKTPPDTEDETPEAQDVTPDAEPEEKDPLDE